MEEENAEKEILQRTLEGPVEKLQLVKSRRGQGVFRDNVIQIEKYCRVTGVRAIEHLRASHIKPWAKSDDLEKVDGNNGLLLSPHVDHLFDRGWIRFEADGTMNGTYKLPFGIKSGSHRVVVTAKLPNGKSTTFTLGILVGKINKTSTLTRVLIAIPISLAVGFGFLLPTQARRRKRREAI